MAVDDMMFDERPGRFLRGCCGSAYHGWSEKRARGVDEDDSEDYDCGTPSRKRRRLNSAVETSPALVTPPRQQFRNACRGLQRFTGNSPSQPLDEPDDAINNFNDTPEEETSSRSFSQMLMNMTSSPLTANSEEDETCETFSSAEPPVFFPISNQRLPRPLRWGRIAMCLLVGCLALTRASAAIMKSASAPEIAAHIIPTGGEPSGRTLREFLNDPAGFSLGMAPAFFGFYGYFGSLAAWEEFVAPDLLQPGGDGGRLKQVAGASAGAMAAILLSAGISPLRAAKFCTDISLTDFADFPGAFALFQGNKFEQVMENYLAKESPCHSLLLEDAILPVAVSAFDLQTMAGQILTTGSMARAARASATFPFLFQPVSWEDGTNDFTLIDGGIADTSGVAGLIGRNPGRVVNLKVGPYFSDTPPLPSQIGDTTEVVSISLQNMPQPHPFKMELGAVAVKAAYEAMKASLDVPLLRGKEDNHYELHIDTTTFWKQDKQKASSR